MKYMKNRIFALFFAVIIFLWIIWSSIWSELLFGPIKDIPGWPYLDPFHLTLFIVVIGLLFEAYRPTLNLEFDKNKKWIYAGMFLLAIAVIVVIAIAFAEIDEPEQNIFGNRTFEYPIGSGEIHVWPNLLWEFLSVFCMETVSLSLLFGFLFMTKSTPEKSKSYMIMLIGAIAFELFVFIFFYLALFVTGKGVSQYARYTGIDLLFEYWFQWDFWAEFVIFIGAIWLFLKDKNTNERVGLMQLRKLFKDLNKLMIII